MSKKEFKDIESFTNNTENFKENIVNKEDSKIIKEFIKDIKILDMKENKEEKEDSKDNKDDNKEEKEDSKDNKNNNKDENNKEDSKENSKDNKNNKILNDKEYIIFSGDRNCKNPNNIIEILKELDPSKHIIVHGNCVGVDLIVKKYAKELNFKVIDVPAKWYDKDYKTYNNKKYYNPNAGPERNLLMIKKYNPKIVYLFHDKIEFSKGTKNMRNLCITYKIPYIVLKINK